MHTVGYSYHDTKQLSAVRARGPARRGLFCLASWNGPGRVSLCRLGCCWPGSLHMAIGEYPVLLILTI